MTSYRGAATATKTIKLSLGGVTLLRTNIVKTKSMAHSYTGRHGGNCTQTVVLPLGLRTQ